MTKVIFKLILSISIFLIHCNKKKIVDYSSYAYIFKNTSFGNCALIEKQIQNGKVNYHAYANVVSSGGCKESSFFRFFTNPQDAKQELDKYYGDMALVYYKHNECSELFKLANIQKNSISVDGLVSLALLEPEGCIQLSHNVFFCKDEASKENKRAKFFYHSITNAKQDMSVNYESQVFINGTINKIQNLQYEEGAIGNLRLASASELALFEGADASSLVYAFPQHKDCLRKIILENSSLKTAYTKIPKLQEFFKEEITVSNRKSILETLTPSLECVYGEEPSIQLQNGLMPAIGICPNFYPRF